MRKKILNLFLIVVCLFSFSSCSQETSSKTKELIEKNIDARGGYEKLNAVKSLKITAKYMQQGRETELILMIKRPNFLYAEVAFPNSPMICGYDGKTTWWFHEARGHTKPQKLPAGQDLIISRYVEFGDLFMNYKKRGQKIEFIGTEYPDGKKVHKLKITLEHDIIRFVYLDADTFLNVKDSFKHGKEPKFGLDVLYKDFREIDGVMFPFFHDLGPGAEQTVIEKIETNVDMDDAIFKMPEKIKKRENLSADGFKRELDAYLTRSTKEDVFSGTVLVAKEGKTIFKKAYGMADRELNIPNTLNTRFSLASINKMFTAVAVAQLVQQGKLSYDDLIGKYLGVDWVRPEVGEKVKISHLLTHTSGMGEYLTDELLGKYLTTEDYKALTRVKTLSYEPGEKWQYCNTGFILLGAIIKKASGANYEEYIKKHIFEPAGMGSTLISGLDKGLADVAMAYGKVDNGGSRQRTVLAGKVNGSSAGGGYSTGEDLLKFAAALAANKLITKESAKLLMSAKPALNARNYGYGFFIYNHPRLGLVIGHGGVAPGVSSNFRMFVDIGYTMIILSNYDKASLAVWSKIESLLPLTTF